MDKFNDYYGIDISKDVFDVMDSSGKHLQYSKDLKGFKEFVSNCSKSSCVVMEATGGYHTQFVHYFSGQKVFVSVVNPLVTKRYI